MADPTMPLTDEQHRQCAQTLFNWTWTLLTKPDRTEDDDEMMAHVAHASYLHWSRVGEPVNFSRGEWLLSRVEAVLGRADGALRHARRCLEICRADDLGPFDLAFAYEAHARAYAVAGESDRVSHFLDLAARTGRGIAAEDDRKVLTDDLSTIPGGESTGT